MGGRAREIERKEERLNTNLPQGYLSRFHFVVSLSINLSIFNSKI